MLLCVWLGLGFGAVEIAVPAFAEAEGNRALAGIALAGFSAGSLVGGLVAGLRPSSDERRRIIVGTFVLTGLMFLPLAATSIGAMAFLLFVAGLPVAPVVAAVDTTGAGDAFVGAFAVGLGLGWPPECAATLGCAAASDSVTRPGTQSSYPDRVRAAALLAEMERGAAHDSIAMGR
jgi:MFS family permease